MFKIIATESNENLGLYGENGAMLADYVTKNQRLYIDKNTYSGDYGDGTLEGSAKEVVHDWLIEKIGICEALADGITAYELTGIFESKWF